MSVAELVGFTLIAAIILAGGLWSSLANRTFHSALGLGVALIGVAALFVFLGSPLVGVIQVLVYVGGILTLLIFAVMFVAGDEEEEVAPTSEASTFLKVVAVVFSSVIVAGLAVAGASLMVSGAWEGIIPLAFAILLVAVLVRASWTLRLGASVALTILLLMAGAVAQTADWQVEGTGGAEDIDAIVQDIFTDHLVAFEVLGVLLTAAMIGALVIARPMVSGLDSDHYPKADRAELERTQETSEPTATFTVTGPPTMAPFASESPAPAPPGTPPAARVGGEEE